MRPLSQGINLLVAVCIAGLSAGCSAFSPGVLVLVDQGRPKAVIVTADEPTVAARDASEAFRKTVLQITGVDIPIVTESRFKDRAIPILIGQSGLTAKAGVRIEQDYDAGDRYVIRVDDRQAILVGNDAGRLRGSAYAVYDLLQRLGCGWYGPDPAWQVIPKKETLAVPPLQVDEKPAFLLRDNWVVQRLGPPLTDAWRIGGRRIDHGHALDRWLPRAKLAAQHPDWFGKSQPCLTHPEVIEYITARLRERLDQEKEQGIVSLSLSANDDKYYCECQRCKAAGNISARYLKFVNAIARNLAKTHPNRYLITFYAYWITHEPPEPTLKAEPGVCVMQVNEGNHMKPWDWPEPAGIRNLNGNDNNYREVVSFEGWRATGAILGIYEWWIPCDGRPIWCKVPWYSGETALRNLRYWQKAGVRYLSYQTGGENGNGFPLRWPLYYVGARGMWDPSVTCRQVMAEACDKLFGSASKPMQRYYEVLEQAMIDAPDKRRGYAWKLPGAEDIYTPGIEDVANTALDETGAIQVEPAERERISQERRLWDQARKTMAEARRKNAEEKKAATRPNQQYK